MSNKDSVENHHLNHLALWKDLRHNDFFKSTH